MYKFLKPDSTNKENEALFKSAKLDDGKTTIYCPESRQYRVFICNQLIAKGVSKTFIEEHLKHLSESMADYYARPEDKTEEYIGYAEEIIKDIVQDNLSPIGCMGEELKKSILNYLKTQKITSKTDIEEIFDILGPKVSIRAKTGGFCFKTTLIPCAEEAGVNKILCAYNLCPNVYSFYYMLDATYTSVKALIESYDQNLMRGYYQSANKDLNDAKSIIARILDKQIIQLGQEMESKGTDYISEKYPHMIPYMSNYESIKEQIKEWKNMKPARG